MNFNAIGGQVDGYIGVVHVIVDEVFFDDFAFIPAEYNEIVVAIMRVGFHDMPENRFAADADHRFGADAGFFS